MRDLSLLWMACITIQGQSHLLGSIVSTLPRFITEEIKRGCLQMKSIGTPNTIGKALLAVLSGQRAGSITKE